MSYKLQRRLLLGGFLFVPMLLMAMLFVYPTARMVFYSFTDWNGISDSYSWVGLHNFVQESTNMSVWKALKNNGIYALNGIVQNVVGLFFAVLLAGKLKGKTAFKMILFVPFILNFSAVVYLFNYLFDYRAGPINMFLKELGASPIRFFSDEHLVTFSLAFISFWRYLGYTMVIYLAALMSVDREIYEAAEVDGCSGWKKFRYITFPSIRRIVELNLFLSLSGALQAFGESLIITQGGPGDASYTFLYYVILLYTKFNSYGPAAALSVLLILLIIVLALIQRIVIMRGESK
ncbi:carbohydrate ABC transporter permease [Cohnella sp. GCM10027633]|uniref:carbohydrate ABC transporter permease n=1 Tax=unclassified Cohnella TaxID=2636738 RepID=UPI00363F32B2